MHGVLCNTKSLAIKHTHDFTPNTEQIDMETISEADKRFILHSFQCEQFFEGDSSQTVLILNFLAWLHFLMERQLTRS